DWHRFKIAWNLSDDEADQLTQQVSYRALGRGAAQHLFAEAQLERLRERVRAALGGHHAKAPDSPGLSLEQLRRSLSAKPQPDVFALLTTELAGSGLLTRGGPYLRLAGHEPALMPAEQKLWERVRPWLDEA